MSKQKGGITVGAVWKLAQPIAQELGLTIWDVRFVKEGTLKYLRIFIDKPQGVNIEDCERMSRAVDSPLDELDPIDQSYILEVSSPGIERELSRPDHFELMRGKEVLVKLFRPDESGQRDFVAELVGLEGSNILFKDLDGTAFEIPKKEASSVRLYENFEENNITKE
ncbi:MAG: ribosome maturation factor RimP [Oscillospiraceae bacterium]|nr:ribosome maturation factor RimP [Oscillospiraceae bacterium]